MMIDRLPSYYNEGRVTVLNGSTKVVGTMGPNWAIYANADDVFWSGGVSVRIAEVIGTGELVLAYPWPGPDLVNASYEIRLTPDQSRMQLASRQVLEALKSGNIEAISDQEWTPDMLIKTTGPGTAELIPVSGVGVQDPNGTLAELAGLASGEALTAIGALTPAANQLAFFDTPNTAALTGLSAFVRTLLDDANAAAFYATLGEIPNAQLPGRLRENPSTSSNLDGITQTGWYRALNTATGAPIAAHGLLMHQQFDLMSRQIWYQVGSDTRKTRYFNGTAWSPWVDDAIISTITTAARSLLNLSGTAAANQMPYFTGPNSAGLTALTALARTLLGNATGAQMFATMGEIPDGSLPARLRTIPLSVTNLNTVTEFGAYLHGPSATGSPIPSAFGEFLHIPLNANTAHQLWFQANTTAGFALRARDHTATWGAWRTL